MAIILFGIRIIFPNYPTTRTRYACFGHGAPTYHYFGISGSTIRDLPSLNTLLFDFSSCSVGAYLEKGNTLFVKAFTTPIGIATNNFQSPLIDFFQEGALHSDISKRAFFGDAYLYVAGTGSQQRLLKAMTGSHALF